MQILVNQETCAHAQLQPKLHLVSIVLKGKQNTYQSVGEHHHGATGVLEQPARLPDGERHNHKDQHEANKGKQGQHQGEGLFWKCKDKNRLRRHSEDAISNPGPPSHSWRWLCTWPTQQMPTS